MARYLKNERQAAILDIIEKKAIQDSKSLAEALKEEIGLEVDRVTLYRDITELGLVNTVLPSGEVGFSTAARVAYESWAERLSKLTVEAAIRAYVLKNYVKIQCIHGCAEAVAASVNGLNLNEVFCSIVARDDVLVICNSDNDAQRVYKILSEVINK